MSDFDVVLERLLDDPKFQSALAADPAAALRGYQLSDDERELLRSQVTQGAGGQQPVESRTTKSGVVGLLAPIAGAIGMAAAAHESLGQGGGPVLQPVANSQPTGLETVGLAQAGGLESVGQAPPGAVGGVESVGFAPAGAQGGVESIGSAGPLSGAESVGAAPDSGQGGRGGQEAFGAGPAEVIPAGPGASEVGTAGPSELADYHPNVDVDGDGSWDSYVAIAQPDGGVDILADINEDGVVDFVGHDTDGDGLIESADYDTNFDGQLDTRLYDDDGDGWMDRSVDVPEDH